jgi:ZIP family zinc transporter
VLVALVLGVIGSSALVIGGAIGSYWRAPSKVTGVLLAFASGSLVAALSFELFPEAVHVGGLAPASAGLFVGAAAFVVANTVLDSWVARGAGDPESVPAPDEVAEPMAGAEADQREKVEVAARKTGAAAGSAVAFGLLAAVTLDGVPENLALGVSLLGDEDTGASVGGSVALLVAIFVSNFPEALVGAVAMRDGGRSHGFVIGIWAATAVLLTAAVVIGRAAFAGVDDTVLAFAMAFAGGAVLASLADTLMPEAFERGRPFNAYATALGFLLAFVLADL